MNNRVEIKIEDWTYEFSNDDEYDGWRLARVFKPSGAMHRGVGPHTERAWAEMKQKYLGQPMAAG